MNIKLLNTLRRATQFAWLLLCNSFLSVFFRHKIYTGPLKCSCVPFLYCHACPSATFSCPMGTLQHYVAIRKIPFFLAGHMSLIGLMIGRTTCGWFCPFGLIQDLLARLSPKKFELPRFFAKFPYLVLAVLVLFLPYLTGEHWYSKLCPFGTIVAGIPWVTWNPINPETNEHTVAPGSVGILFAIKMMILVGFLGLFTVVKRPFCRYVCPMGLFFSWFNGLSLVQLRVSENCTHCGACKKSCPVDLKVYEEPNSPACIRCLNCTACKHVDVAAPILESWRSDAKRQEKDLLDGEIDCEP